MDTAVSQNNNILTANANAANYQWLDCDNGFAAVAGAVNINFTALTSGNYAVLVSQNNCMDTSACFAVIITETDNYHAPAISITIHPNPFSQETVLQSGTAFNNATLTVYNSEGQIVQEMANISGQSIVFQRGNLPSGIYFLRLGEKNKVSSAYKLIIVD
ncbi:MAG: T9SS type A sorting domain-containing protein [Phycisphaerae bacterium]|nr:T9SS type A sorting domain-containing protein [Saprospiraceae bacterium]